MKINRNYFFISISSIALLFVLIIQIIRIIETAEIKEELFNEKANIVLSKSIEALMKDKETTQQLNRCIGENEMHKIDSILKNKMIFYDFYIRYSFELINSNIEQEGILKNNQYKKKLDEAVFKDGLELVLYIPEKKIFIMEEMSTTFITSILLIIIVLFFFWQTIKSLLKEKEIAELKTEFLNNMTHEFKTPLTNIALATKMINKDVNITKIDKIKHYSEIILEENDKLKLQVDQILSMSSLEKGEIPILMSNLDFHKTLHYSLKNIRIQIENKKGSINLKLEAQKCFIYGNLQHINNLICNLIDNGIKYSNDIPEINIQTYNLNSNLVIIISDNGIGIGKEYQSKVFDKFFRIPNGNLHNVKGFGLGLTYVKKIIEIHNGNIALQSEKGKGTTFKITIPVNE